MTIENSDTYGYIRLVLNDGTTRQENHPIGTYNADYWFNIENKLTVDDAIRKLFNKETFLCHFYMWIYWYKPCSIIVLINLRTVYLAKKGRTILIVTNTFLRPDFFANRLKTTNQLFLINPITSDCNVRRHIAEVSTFQQHFKVLLLPNRTRNTANERNHRH